MSEQNILNTAAGSLMNPDYTIPITNPDIMAMWQARSGKSFNRTMLARGHVFELHWDKADFTTYRALRQWAEQYRSDFFSYFDIEDNRYYSGRFVEGSFKHERVANAQVNVSATFVEIPGLPMFQYPSNWGVDSVFYEERDGFNADLVKLTGTWDHRTNNLALWSEAWDNAVYTNLTTGTATAPVVTADQKANPIDGAVTADKLAFPTTDASSTSRRGQLVTLPRVPVAGDTYCGSLWLSADVASNMQIALKKDNAAGTGVGAGVTAPVPAFPSWQRFSCNGDASVSATTALMLVLLQLQSSAATNIYAFGTQIEFGTTPSPYAKTTSAAAPLSSPNLDARLHGPTASGGAAYWNAGTDTTAAAEWIYFGYGFRVWAYKGPDMGIMQITLDGVILGTVDLYAAVPTVSAVVFTSQSQVLANHRVKLSPTNTKNAASSAFIIDADAIEVMR